MKICLHGDDSNDITPLRRLTAILADVTLNMTM
jgi:hypothetical protein